MVWTENILMRFQSETSVFNFLGRSVKGALSLYIFDKRAGTMLTNGS